MPKRYFLHIEMKEVVTEGVPDHSFFSRKQKTHLKLLLDAIDQAARDKKISAILLAVRRPEIGWAQAEELVEALDRFRAEGKNVIAFLERAGNKEFLLASAAGSVYLTPSGSVDLVGLRAELVFFKDALQWLGVEPDLEHIGKYKSAGDVLTRQSISEAHQEQTEALIEDTQRYLVERVSRSRARSSEEVIAWMNGGPYSAQEARQAGLVDELLFEDQVVKKLEDQKLVKRDLGRYRVGEGFWRRRLGFRRPQIALITADGMIAGGKSRRTGGRRVVCGSETMRQFLSDARKRKRIRGVVLRVNSPGGSALASDIVWREIQLTSEKKPVVVSMGDTAASGGYYIATAARRILSQRTTVTGSIGVIGGKFVIRELLEKLKLGVDSVSGAAHSGIHSMLQPFSAEERERVRRHMEEFYRVGFIPKVAQSRGRSEEQILQLAQGRVWSGERAQRNGLVDRIGGIREALEEVRGLCRIPARRRVRVVIYTRKLSLREMILPGIGSVAWLDAARDLLQIFQEEVLALLPFEIRIR